MAKRAAATAKLDRLAAGNKSVFDANMNDIAALGVGMELYFLLIKYLSWAFFTMGIVSLPAIIVNYYGDGVTAKMVDPLQLAYASLGNQGVNPDIASDPTQCLPIGEIDCTGATVNTPFTTDPQKVAWIVTSSDAIYSFVFLIVYLLFRRHARRAIDAHQNEHLTPAKYAVFVRGLPPDATAREVLEHFNSRYDPTQEEIYYPLWLGCCWGRRPRRTKHSLSKEAVNCNVVNNLEHLWRPDDLGQARPVTGQTRLSMAGLARPSTVGQHGKLSPARPSTVGQSRPLTGPPGTPRLDDSVAKQEEHHMYLGTWIAEVSIAHPTGGLLRTFLAMEVLTRKISEAQALVSILTQEKEQAELALQNWAPPPGKKNPKKPKSTFKKADELLLQATTKKLERLQAAMTKKTSKLKALKQANKQLQEQQKQEAEAAAADNTCTPGQAKTVKKKKAPDAKPFDLNACECAFVVFNNLESRRRCLQDYRRSDQWLPPQSAQQTFKDKAPPAGLCESTLPEIFYASPDFLDAKATWSLEWDVNATCAPGDSGETRYHVAYSNGILNDITVEKPTSPVNELHRCIDPCVSEKSNTKCNTLACFSGAAREETGEDCETYLASHALYCLCTAQLQSSIAEFGVIDGPQELWNTYVPCRGFLTDFLAKNAFIVIASAVVVIVNIVLKSTLRGFASFERHTSESAKASAVALKMFAAQFLNTAIIVLVVNAALSLSAIPVLGELFRGKYSDFQRDWYPTVGMGVTMTMLINAIMPQCILLLQFVKTAYDEALGETVLGLLPWALVAHLGFSSWMYGNTDLLKAPTLKLGWVFELFGLSTDGATDTEEMYNKLVAQATTFDPLGKNGFIVKVLHVNVMLMFFLFVLVLAGILLSAVWVRVLLPVLRNTVGRILLAIWSRLRPLFRFCRCRSWAAEPAPPIDTVPKAPLSARPVPTEVVLPEFTDVFRKSVGPKFRPDAKVGFSRDSSRPSELVRYWKEETTSNGFHRKAGDPMRTWEAIQAPVKTYAIEANAKYRLAVAELVAASRRALTIAENPETPSTKPEDATAQSEQRTLQKMRIVPGYLNK
ncbi:hypothetical protein PInf_004307 [Phytophthora infestans]|nr:hypothetical protein PInf_004307 [Phytophthora infestans]